MIPSAATFERFFDACGVPASMVSKYAAKFVKERIHPQLIKDLGKDDLRELGISALGDQLSIMRYIKQCEGNPPEFATIQKNRTVKQSEIDSDDDEPMIVDSGTSKFKAPDRDEIYHVKMPEGSLPKTRKILEKHEVLREQGVIKRGVSGVRRSGIELRTSLNNVSSRSKMIARKHAPTTVELQDTDISSSTGFLPMGTLRSDAISSKTTIVTDNNPPQRTKANVSLTQRFESLGATRFRVQLGSHARAVNKQPNKRILPLYDDLIDDAEQMVEVRPSKPTRRYAPIAERVQIVSPQKRRRPVITVRGKKIDFEKRRTSILDRISVTK